MKRKAKKVGIVKSASKAWKDVTGKIEDVRERAEDAVKDNPASAVVVAAVIGAAVATGVTLLLTRRKKPFVRRMRDYF